MADNDYIELDWDRFDALLKERGLTAYRVSKDTGIAQTTFSSWKHRHQSTISAKTNRKLAKYFNVPIGYFHGEYKIHDDYSDPVDPRDPRDLLPFENGSTQDQEIQRGYFSFDLDRYIQEKVKKEVRRIIKDEIKKCLKEVFSDK